MGEIINTKEHKQLVFSKLITISIIDWWYFLSLFFYTMKPIITIITPVVSSDTLGWHIRWQTPWCTVTHHTVTLQVYTPLWHTTRRRTPQHTNSVIYSESSSLFKTKQIICVDFPPRRWRHPPGFRCKQHIQSQTRWQTGWHTPWQTQMRLPTHLSLGLSCR